MFVISAIIIIYLYTSVENYESPCVVYNFEENFDSWSHDPQAICIIIGTYWNWEYYRDFHITPPNARSTKFITPASEELSCVTIFPILFTNGLLEINIYSEIGYGDPIPIMNLNILILSTLSSSALILPQQFHRENFIELGEGHRTIRIRIDTIEEEYTEANVNIALLLF